MTYSVFLLFIFSQGIWQVRIRMQALGLKECGTVKSSTGELVHFIQINDIKEIVTSVLHTSLGLGLQVLNMK